MNILTRLKTHKFLVFALIFAFLNMGAIFSIFGFQEYSDTAGYVKVIHWFRGGDAEVAPERILRPLGSLIAIPFEFFGRGAGLIVQNMVFYFLCAFLIFKIADLVYHNKKQALLASIFFVTATSVLEVGLAYLTDMGAWFFYLLSIFLTLLYFKNKDEKLIALNGFLSGLGFLMKENGGLGILFFGLMILLAKEFNVKEKIFKMARFAAFFIIPFAALQIFMYRYFQFTSFDWFLGQMNEGYNEEGPLLTFLRYLGQFFRTMGILWIFLLVGAFRELREKNWERIKIFLALLPSSFSFLLWPTGGGGRVVFIFAPLGILLATYGCKKIRPFILVLIVIAILILNYWFVSVNQEIPFVNLIYTSLFSR